MNLTVQTARHPEWLTNTYLVSGANSSILIDAGMALSSFDLNGVPPIQAIFLTHHHHDHLCDLASIRHQCNAPVFTHRLEKPTLTDVGFLEDGEEHSFGEIAVRAIHTPGHTRGHLSLLISGAGVFTGDLLFRLSVGGTTAPHHADINALRDSILNKILTLPETTTIFPGHMDPTTVGEERSQNKIILAWQGQVPITQRVGKYDGEKVIVLAEAPDYDGDTKVWIKFADGKEEVVAGSDLKNEAAV